MTIDWTKAPSWARYHAFNGLDGFGIWFEIHPNQTDWLKTWTPHRHTYSAFSDYRKPADLDWATSVVAK